MAEPSRPEPYLDSLGIVQAILDSYRRYLGQDLIPRSGDPLLDAAALDSLDAVVLSHDGGEDPRFVYANQAAARTWKTTVEHLVGMPSRLSAPPEQRQARATMLNDARRDGFITGYRGIRVAADGSLFEIEDATLWTVEGFPVRPGQAVVFMNVTTVW